MTTNAQPSNSGPQAGTGTTPGPVSQGQEPSSNSAETKRPEPNRPLSEAEKADAVANLLSGRDPHDGSQAGQIDEDGGEGGDGAVPPGNYDEQAGGDREGERAVPEEGHGDAEGREDQRLVGEKPKTLTEAAERLGIEPADLYKLELTTGDGETVKLGDLKDAWQTRKAAERETAERAAALDARETAIIAEQRLWGEIGETLNAALTPQNREKLTTHLREREALERDRMVRAMPEMADPNRFDQFRTEVVETLGKYGYQPHEVVVGDHRQLVILRDLIRAQKRLKELSNFKPAATPPQSAKVNGRSKTPSSTEALVQKARNSRHESDKVAGVAALLNGD